MSKVNKCILIMLFWVLLFRQNLYAQEKEFSPDNLIEAYYNTYLNTVLGKLENFDKSVGSSREKLFKRIGKKSKKLLKKISEVDSVKTGSNISSLISNKQKTIYSANVMNGNIYLPYLDSLRCSLAFIKKIGEKKNWLLDPRLERNFAMIEKAKANIEGVENLKAIVQQQKNLLGTLEGKYKEQVHKYLLSVNKEFYYYNEKVKTYKEILSDHKKIEQKLMEVVNNLPAFQSFFKENSAVAGLFQIPAFESTSIAGLQTRRMMQNVLKEKLSSSLIDASGLLKQQIQTVQAKMDEVKQQFSGDGSAADLPDFQPKEIKKKTFLERVELGANNQFSGRTNALPTNTEITMAAGYKITDRIIAGVGLSYRLGLGDGIKRIALSNEGIGISTFYKMQLKGNFFISGGWEQNYFQRFYAFNDLGQGQTRKSSALLGIGKKIGFSKSFLGSKWGKERVKKSNIVILYDFLYNQQLPQTNAIKLRYGFTF